MQAGLSPQQQLYLCIDQGGHATRAIIFDGEGRHIAEGYQNISVHHPQADFVEHDAEEMLNSVRAAIDKALQQIGPRKTEILAAGFAVQRSNIVCWDRETGAALSPIISWQDRRAQQWLQQFKPRAEEIHKTTGLFLSPHYGTGKLHWCLENLPGVKQAQSENRLCFGPMAAFFVRRLTREHNFYTDVVNASRTQLWSLKSNDWDAELLTLFGIPADCLPECKPTRYNYGTLDIEGADIPVQLVTGDQSAAMFAYGRLQPDTAYINTGTGAFISRPSGRLKIYGRRLLTSVIDQDDTASHYVLEGTVNGAGSALTWLEEQHGVRDIELNLPRWLNEVENPPLFLNGVSGLAAPFWLADFPIRFDREVTTAAEKAVAVIESIVFLLCANAQEMKKLSSPPEQLQLTGGLAVLDSLCQKMADLSGLPTYRPMECEATARGTAYLLAEQPRHWPENDPGIWFKPADNPALKARYQAWTDLMLATMRKSA
ncbi:MAG: FGGY family carbohydrate kinase [Gammaproteobacteria bacterium]|nr:FGGY family carbohydrate kinase [Gammaproteobacteria bacterium]MDH5651725.1 FGGY family carbohydrate kinase [Gammaproteobacteria bacterium]